MDVFSTIHDQINGLGDFNVEIGLIHVGLSGRYNYKNSESPTCIRLVLTNVPHSFQSTCVPKIGLSEFHFKAISIIRKKFKKFRPIIIKYWSYNHVSNKTFQEIATENIQNKFRK